MPRSRDARPERAPRKREIAPPPTYALNQSALVQTRTARRRPRLAPSAASLTDPSVKYLYNMILVEEYYINQEAGDVQCRQGGQAPKAEGIRERLVDYERPDQKGRVQYGPRPRDGRPFPCLDQIAEDGL